MTQWKLITQNIILIYKLAMATKKGYWEVLEQVAIDVAQVSEQIQLIMSKLGKGPSSRNEVLAFKVTSCTEEDIKTIITNLERKKDLLDNSLETLAKNEKYIKDLTEEVKWVSGGDNPSSLWAQNRARVFQQVRKAFNPVITFLGNFPIQRQIWVGK